MTALSKTIEVNAEPNTPEYSEKIFSTMNKLIEELTKDLYDEQPVEYLVRTTNGSGFKVVMISHLSPKYYTMRTLKYCRTRKQAEEYKMRCLKKKNKKGTDVKDGC